MLMKQICARALKYQARCRFFSSGNNPVPLNLYHAINALLRDDKGYKNYPLEMGATRYWELNSKSQYYCIGASGPINLENTSIRSKIVDLIDFNNKADDKLHIDIVKCPNILSARLVTAFPRQLFDRDSIHVIKLSYDQYTDKIKGKLDCLIAANYICKKIYDRGDFSFYSGSGIKNADNEILFHLPNNVDHDKTKNLHMNITLTSNDCWKIQPLDDNDVGIVYVNHRLDCDSLKKIIEKRSIL